MCYVIFYIFYIDFFFISVLFYKFKNLQLRTSQSHKNRNGAPDCAFSITIYVNIMMFKRAVGKVLF